VARFYGLDEANARLNELGPLLERLRADRDALADIQRELVKAGQSNGGPEHAEEVARREANVREIVRRMRKDVAQIEAWGVTLRDISTGLVDFAALANGRPIWLCWRLGEDTIDWWHEVDVGFDQRKPLSELS
jgi:hypothetical protein